MGNQNFKPMECLALAREYEAKGKHFEALAFFREAFNTIEDGGLKNSIEKEVLRLQDKVYGR